MNLKLIIPFLFLLLAKASFAQNNNGIITGYVKDDRTKAPLNEAVITLTSNAFVGQRFAITDSTGKYFISHLPEGRYTIEFEMEGYRKLVQDSVVLKPGMSLNVSFQLGKNRKFNARVLAATDSILPEPPKP